MEDTGKGHLAQSAAAVGKPQPKELPQDLRHRMEPDVALADLKEDPFHSPSGVDQRRGRRIR